MSKPPFPPAPKGKPPAKGQPKPAKGKPMPFPQKERSLLMSKSNKFVVTYPSGKGTHIEVTDAKTIEEFANSHFGSVDYKEHGISVEMVTEEQESEPAKFEGIPSPAVVVAPVMEVDDTPMQDPNDDADNTEDEE